MLVDLAQSQPRRMQAFLGEHRDQETRFNGLADRFGAVYEQFLHASRQQMPTAAARLLPKPSFKFLENEEIYGWLGPFEPPSALQSIRSQVEQYLTPSEIKLLLTEDIVGMPRLLDANPPTSAVRLWNAYYLVSFEKTVGRALDEFGALTVWGGGYGTLARLLRLRNPHATILIINSPILASLQWLYLSSVIGEEAVRIVMDERPLDEGFISVTTPELALGRDFRPDMFIALWSLGDDETARRVLEREFFGARHFLIGLDDGSSTMGSRIRNHGKFIGEMTDLAPKCLVFG